MDLKGILAISGQPGLFKMISQAKNSIIVESLITEKRMPAYATSKISALEDIAIYTYEEDVQLVEVFKKICEKENGGPAIDHKVSAKELKAYLEEVLPDFDQDRVYNSDIKKIFQWYNVLQEVGLVDANDSTEEVDEEAAEEVKDQEVENDDASTEEK